MISPHPYELGPRDGRWQPHGCKHCDQRPGADIHDPRLWEMRLYHRQASLVSRFGRIGHPQDNHGRA